MLIWKSLMNEVFEVPSLGSRNFFLALQNYDSKIIKELLFEMYRIRTFEEFCAQYKRDGVIGGPVHLAIGQEAIPVGLSKSLNKNDYVFSAHRSHAHILALQSSSHRLFAEILGKSTGLSRGFGGSMHLVDASVGFYGSVPIVAGTVPIALGAAFSVKYKNLNSIAVSCFGDGALEEGVVQESLNLASLMRLPILFICENNLMASHMHLSQRQTNPDLTRFADANGLKSKRIDGNDILEVYEVTKEAISSIRETSEPFFIEAITYRQLGHVDWRADIDVGVTRSESEVAKWKNFDPISRLKDSAILYQLLLETEINEIYELAKKEISESWNKAMADDYSDPDSIMKNVISNEIGNNND